MIVSIGEALIDKKNGKSFMGGCPYNVAIALARQNVPVLFAGGISSDENGNEILESLIDNCVFFDPVFCSSQKRTMTTEVVDVAGNTDYKFDWEDTSAFDIGRTQLEQVFSLNDDIECVFFGSVSFTDIKTRTEITSFLDKKPEIIRFFDPNIRPFLISDMEYYRDVLDRSAGLCDVVKLSTEDLKIWGRTEVQVLDLCKEHLIVTRGADGATWYNKQSGKTVSVSAYSPENVVDTIGCGDTFSGTMLALFHKNGKFSDFIFTEKEMKDMLEYACKAAAINCTREGCNPPTSEQIDDFTS